MRIRCWILGCGMSSNPYEGHCCETCKANLYDGTFYQLGCRPVEWVRSLMSWWRRKSFYRSHPCETCKKTMRFTEEHCCSSKCYEDQPLPF